jgi:hypothetical protein
VGPFVSGTWTGPITVLGSGSNIVLRAVHDSGRGGNSAGFRVEETTGATPVPSEVRLHAVTFSGTDVRIRFPSSAGGRYCVESTESLAQPVWKVVADNVPGTGTLLDVIDARGATQPQQFYRVRKLP